MSYCAFDEAFTGPVVPKKSTKARMVPPQMAGIPVQGEIPEAMRGSTEQGMVGRLDSGAAAQDFFPLPGETAAPEEWQKAFTLEGSDMPRPDGAVSVAGKSTLWRNVPVPAVPAQTATPIASEVGHRLDMLTRQLESLTAPTPMQSTAELFLFVAIGLLLLLAIDTLLRFATSMASKQQSGGGGGGIRMGRGRGWRHFR